MLSPGTFTCDKTLVISTSGVVLRGSGSGNDGTTIRMVGPRHRAITIDEERGQRGERAASDDVQERNARQDSSASRTTIADAYVPAGATKFTVADASGFAVGDTIAIRRPTTAAWIKFMGWTH
jgi:hypothetical protein